MKHIDGRWLRWATTNDSEAARSSPGPAGSSHAGEGTPRAVRAVTEAELAGHIESTALAFRGYDVANLGRSAELLDHEVYGPVVRRTLDEVSAIASDVIHAELDLPGHIRAGDKTSLETFP